MIDPRSCQGVASLLALAEKIMKSSRRHNLAINLMHVMHTMTGPAQDTSLMTTVAVQGDFSANLKLLQRYPPLDVNVLLRKAAELQA